jgi:hypothetical protein
VKRNGDLNQALKKFLLRIGSCAPNVLEGFVGVEEGSLVKQRNSALKGRLRIH